MTNERNQGIPGHAGRHAGAPAQGNNPRARAAAPQPGHAQKASMTSQLSQALPMLEVDEMAAPMGAPVITFDHVTKTYPAQPKKPALSDVTLQIFAGEFIFLVGHSGSGKSTFIRLLTREIKPTSGKIYVADKDLTTMRNWRVPYLRRNIGCVFQDFKLLPNKTVFENVAFALEVIGKSRHVIKTQVPEVLRLVGLSDKLNSYPDQLSGGQQQRVSIARAIVNRPPLLICDEPTGNLDPQTSRGIMDLLKRINRTGTTVLVATHDREMVDNMRRRVIALDRGISPATRTGGCTASMSSLFYFFKESLQGFARNLSTTLGSIITIFLSLLIIGVFLVGGTIVERLVSSIEDEVSITAYVADDAPQESIDAVTAMIQGMDGVESVGFTTKEQALENFSNSMTTNPEIIEQLDGTNPLPASIDVSLADPQKVDEIAAAIEADETFRSICDEPDNPADSLKYGQKTVDRLFSVTKYVRYLGVALVLLLVFIALVFINNTIRLAIMARRKEIAIMRLVGASNGFIRGPFLMEGALHALIGSLLAVGVLQVLRMYGIPKLQSALSFLSLDVSGNTYIMIYIVLVVAGLVIGLLGSAFAMRRYLKV